MARDHGYHPVRIIRIIEETPDTRTYVLDAPFSYRAGQFLTVRACGTQRSYSMSSSPDADPELMTTVKRVPGGLVSNWIHDHLAAGDVIEASGPAGRFCLRDTAAPLVALCGGSGVTPILSLVKSALATTDRTVRVLSAHRDADSVIFGPAFAELTDRHPDRLSVHEHLDSKGGLVTGLGIRAFAEEVLDGDFYVCGPAPFMDLAERALLVLGVEPSQIFIERFATDAADDPPARPAAPTWDDGTVTIVLSGKRHTVPQHGGETLLESARRAGLAPPFSCEAGNCATCIAQIVEGKATMRANNALDEDEIAEGWILTCQGEPAARHVTVVYED